MSIYENLKKVFSELVQFYGLLLKCCKSGKKRENVVTEAKNNKFIFLNLLCQHILGMADNLVQKKFGNFYCKICDYSTCRKSQYERHLSTSKHKKLTNADILVQDTNSKHICSCGKEFGHRQSLHRHKQNCSGVPTDIVSETTTQLSNTNDDLVNVIVKQQEETSELKKLLIEQSQQIHAQQKQIQDLIPQLQQVTNITNNTTNNKFNLNFFLNEQCKDAISIQHFIENLNIGIRELEHMGDVGYVQGMMSIFSETLGKMDIYERPLHCTDLKRDTLYIKQGDTWTKDTEDKTELKKIVETVKCRNYGSLRLWEREHPEAFECDTQDNIDYMRISSESLGGFNSTDTIKLNKIIKHVVKEVYVK